MYTKVAMVYITSAYILHIRRKIKSALYFYLWEDSKNHSTKQ